MFVHVSYDDDFCRVYRNGKLVCISDHGMYMTLAIWASTMNKK